MSWRMMARQIDPNIFVHLPQSASSVVRRKNSSNRADIPILFVDRSSHSVVKALLFLHSLSLVHGNLKPTNVILACSPKPDAYSAPEVHRGQPPDAASDAWSLGLLLFEFLELEHSRASDFVT
jgi:serine/threonine protein kinase